MIFATEAEWQVTIAFCKVREIIVNIIQYPDNFVYGPVVQGDTTSSVQKIDLVLWNRFIVPSDLDFLTKLFDYSFVYEDYGFLDTSGNDMAYDMVAQQLLGKRRLVEGAGAGRLMSESDRKTTMEQLQQTTIEEDRSLLNGETNPSLIAAYNYRIGVKSSLSKYGDI